MTGFFQKLFGKKVEQQVPAIEKPAEPYVKPKPLFGESEENGLQKILDGAAKIGAEQIPEQRQEAITKQVNARVEGQNREGEGSKIAWFNFRIKHRFNKLMGINVTDTSGANQNDVIQRHGETREIQGIEIAPISTKVEEATRRIQNGQRSTADVRIVNQAAQNTQAVNNNLRRRGL